MFGFMQKLARGDILCYMYETFVEELPSCAKLQVNDNKLKNEKLKLYSKLHS